MLQGAFLVLAEHVLLCELVEWGNGLKLLIKIYPSVIIILILSLKITLMNL